MRELSLKQRTFISEYLIHGIGTKAAAIAGYKGNSHQLAVIAEQNLTKLDIKQAIEAKRAEIALKMGINEVKLTENFVRIAEKAESERQYSPAIAANAELGKHIGYYAKDKPTQVQLQQVVITEADRVKWLAEQQARLERAERAGTAIAGEAYVDGIGNLKTSKNL